MENNRKDQGKTKPKTETIELKKVQGVKIGTEGLAQKQKEVFSSGNLISSGKDEEDSFSSLRCRFKILVVDDDENIRDVLEDFLNFEGHKPILAKDGEEALKLFSERDFDVVITDLGMPGMSGWELSRYIKQRKPEMPVVIITGWGAQLSCEDLKKNKVEWILSKPFNLDQVQQLLERVGAMRLKKEV